jgi:hypothetical protein
MLSRKAGRLELELTWYTECPLTITRVQAAGVTIGVDYDDELNRKACLVIEDLLFKLNQKTDEVSDGRR